MTALVFIALMAFSVVLAFMAKRGVLFSYTHLTLPTNREV